MEMLENMVAGDGIPGRLCFTSQASVVSGGEKIFKFGTIFVSLTVLRDSCGRLQSHQVQTALEGCISLGKEMVESHPQESDCVMPAGVTPRPEPPAMELLFAGHPA